MTMKTRVVTYPTGLVERCTTEHETLEAFVNEKFGSAYAEALEAGVTISEEVDTEPSTPATEGDPAPATEGDPAPATEGDPAPSTGES